MKSPDGGIVTVDEFVEVGAVTCDEATGTAWSGTDVPGEDVLWAVVPWLGAKDVLAEALALPLLPVFGTSAGVFFGPSGTKPRVFLRPSSDFMADTAFDAV